MFLKTMFRGFGINDNDGDTEQLMDPAAAVEAELLSLPPTPSLSQSAVQRYFSNGVVFITGGSGFLGKQLQEKLFRSCNVKKIYLLMRPKKGKKVQDRLQEILQDPVYNNLRQQQPDFADRIVCVRGDVSEIRLGLGDEEWDTIANEVDTIFHVAATTRFDESLRVATLINVRGTREVIKLARECTHLRSLVHVSTAYAHATTDRIGRTVREQFYRTPLPPETMIRLAEEVEGGRLEGISHKLIEGWPNTYTFAKAVAEEQIRLAASDLPVCIVRPSIVISAHHEPSPGWMDMSCAFSASGLVIGGGLGIIHVIQTAPGLEVSLVPVDYVNNALISAAWEVGTRQREVEREITIYNVVMSQDNKLNWDMIRKFYLELREELAMPSAVWVAYMFTVSNYYMFLLLTVLLHFVPGFVLDGVMMLLGRKRRFVNIYKKVFKLSNLLSYFLNSKHNLDGTNTEILYQKLSPNDQKIFFFDMRTLDWFEYCKIWLIGTRKYIIKDGLKNTLLGRKKQKWFRLLNYFLMIAYALLLLYILVGSFRFVGRVFGLF